MREDLTFTLDEENEKKLYEIMYSMDVKNTQRFWIKDKRGYSAFYEKVIHCKDCKHHHYDGHRIPYCDRKDYGYGWKDDDFCSKPERKEE